HRRCRTRPPPSGPRRGQGGRGRSRRGSYYLTTVPGIRAISRWAPAEPPDIGPDASGREGPPALQGRAGLGEPEKCQSNTRREARSDDHSDHLRHQAARTTVQDRQRMASAPAPTPSEEGHPAAHRSRLPEGLDGSGTGPVAVEIHQGRGGPEVSPRVNPSQEEQPHG